MPVQLSGTLACAGRRPAYMLVLIKVSRSQLFLQNGPLPAGHLVWARGPTDGAEDYSILQKLEKACEPGYFSNSINIFDCVHSFLASNN